MRRWEKKPVQGPREYGGDDFQKQKKSGKGFPL